MGIGAQIRECEEGPTALFPEIEALYPLEVGGEVEVISEFNRRLAGRVYETMEEGLFPIVLGGDHSVAIGTWNGVKKSVDQPLTLIWIDAHLDGHTHETSPSNAIHGMPLASLMGYGHPNLAKLLHEEPALKPENLIVIGPRSYEKGELELFEKLNVKVFWGEEVKQRGMLDIANEALSLIQTDHIGISLDLDVLDPKLAPGVGSPEPDGVGVDELMQTLELFKNKISAFELVEYNPNLDFENRTADIAHKVLSSITDCQQILRY